MAAIEQNCIYKSITMVAGETFVLPPGAEVISVSNIANVTSSCGDLTVAETKCYQIHWVMNEDPEGTFGGNFQGPIGTITINNINNAWEDSDDNSQPIYIGKMGGLGSTVDNGTNVSISDLSALESAIANSGLSGAIQARKYKYGTAYSNLSGDLFSTHDSGYHSYDLYFRTTEDIAKLFYLEITSSGGNLIQLARMFAFEIECEVYDAIVSDVTMC